VKIDRRARERLDLAQSPFVEHPGFDGDDIDRGQQVGEHLLRQH